MSKHDDMENILKKARGSSLSEFDITAEVNRLTRRCMAGFHLSVAVEFALNTLRMPQSTGEFLKQASDRYNNEIEGL